MMTIRKANERGHAQHGWLDSRFTFSFADYYDPAHMGFRALRVINDDHIAAGQGFPMHPHQDMEIVTYVLDGAVAHRDSTGTSAVVHAGEVQRMTAGAGVRHSEYNPSPTDPLHLLQIWILPERRGLVPGYEQKRFWPADLDGKLCVIANRAGSNGALTIHQDAALYATKLNAGQSVTHPIASGRHAWVHVARGQVTLSGQALTDGDGAAISVAAGAPPQDGGAEGTVSGAQPKGAEKGDAIDIGSRLLTSKGGHTSGEATIALTAIVPAEVLIFDLA
jgi:redox-sensitive bicupin YhaK (pirin superfamily)